MENKELLLSICIPTNGVVEWVVPVIESIYAQGVDNALFEVVITDNGDKDDLQEAVKKYDYPNLNYSRNNSKGFTNQIDAFEKCQGVFCKMLNHRSKMLPGSIIKIISVINRYKEEKPIIYFSNGLIHGARFIECANINDFVDTLGVRASWSAGTGVWNSDINNIDMSIVDTTFPHTYFLFGIRQNSKYIIWNDAYFNMQDETGKGGYDVFDAFAVRYLKLINKLEINKRISINTFSNVKMDVFKFLCSLYLNEVLLPTKNTFIIQNVYKSINVYYNWFYYLIMVFWAYVMFTLIRIKKTIHRE